VDGSTLQALVLSAVEDCKGPVGTAAKGAPFAPDRVREELNLLRAALVPPYRSDIVFALGEGRQEAGTGRYWVVARHDGTVVYYDETTSEYCLAQVWPDGRLESIGVRGDLPGVFMAR
jgi:hypothetical protein